MLLISILASGIAQGSESVAQISASPAAQTSSSPSLTRPAPNAVPLTDAQLKDPVAALAATRKFVGAEALQRAGALYVTGFAEIQEQSMPFTSAVDVRTGFSRTIVLLPHNAGTYEFGIDSNGGWTAVGGRLRAFAVSHENLVTARYVNRFGFLDANQRVAVKEVGVDPDIGDRITMTPSGGASLLTILRPATALPSAIQFGNGQVNVFSDYRIAGGMLFPFRIMQGTDAKALTVFQASNVELLAASPDPAVITRPTLSVESPSPTATGAPK